jgi:hypothetical protein
MGARHHRARQGAAKMKSAKYISAMLAAVCLSSAVYAQNLTNQKPVPPKSHDQIALVGCIRTSPALDFGFFSAYDKPSKTPFVPYVELEVANSGYEARKMIKRGFASGGSGEKGAIGRMTEFRYQINGYRELVLIEFRAVLSNCGDVMATLPVMASVKVPPDTSFAYFGTLTYKFKSPYLTIQAVERSDEFDAAKAYIRERYGEAAAASLVRVTLVPMDQEE